MANASFTRDEVILALDVLYSSGDQRLTAESRAITDLSELLNRLPIHAQSSRREIFRNPSGVLNQIISFRRSYEKGVKDKNVGAIFYEIADEYENRHNELHLISLAIQRNLDLYDNLSFGSDWETNGFPEGALLGHLHRIIEARDYNKVARDERCRICGIETNEVYNCNRNILTIHLLVPITDLDAHKRYGASDYITVCPNCHEALHAYRPWLGREDYEAILC